LAVLGKGEANGAISLLHAAGLGYGASLAIDLPLIVRLLDSPYKTQPEDKDDILGHTVRIWQDNGHTLPTEELHWAVISKIPQRQGLKSSSALCIAALRALCDATNTSLEDSVMVDLARDIQLAAGVSLTGSIDDAWASLTGGWKLVDINAENSAEGIIMESPGLPSADWEVVIVLGKERKKTPSLEEFAIQQSAFFQAFNALQEGNEIIAMTWNGRAMLGVLNDADLRRMTNDSFINGARAASVSGSGNAMAILVPAVSSAIHSHIISWYSQRTEHKVIQTKIINGPMPKVEED
jgi:shikimate kinase